MTRAERKLFFEQLVALRAVYRAEIHEPLALSIEDAITFAADTFNAVAATDAATGATSAASTSTTGSTGSTAA